MDLTVNAIIMEASTALVSVGSLIKENEYTFSADKHGSLTENSLQDITPRSDDTHVEVLTREEDQRQRPRQ